MAAAPRMRMALAGTAFACLALVTACTTASAPGPALAGQLGAPAGTGPSPGVALSVAEAPGYTVYRPLVLPPEPMPVVLWGNGACRDNGLSASHFLREIASHGYLVIANGRPASERPPLAELPAPEAAPEQAGAPPMPPPQRVADETSVAQYLAGIDLAVSLNTAADGPLARAIDTSRVAALGHSCGGLQALAAGADPRIGVVMALASGVYVRQDGARSGVTIAKDDLLRLHTPVAYLLGGPSDISWPNGTDDYARIDHVPALLASLPVGHGGTFALVNGGAWATFATDWLDWQLKGDVGAQARILSADCPYCDADGWSVAAKNW